MEQTISLKQDPEAVFQEIDQLLVRAEQAVNLYGTVTPSNWQEERDRFLSWSKDDPAFTYSVSRTLKAHVQDIRDELERYHDTLQHSPLPDDRIDTLRKYYLDTLEDAVYRTDIVLNLGDRETVRHRSQHLWGTPDPETITLAQDILDGKARILDDLVDIQDRWTDADRFRNDLETLFQQFDLYGWDVTYTEKTTHVDPINKQVRIRGSAEARINARHDRLLLHEFGVHVLRAANGWKQPHTLFAVGLHRYETTEEGITTFLEYATGLLSEQLLRRYALRVLAVQSVLDYNSFPETFSLLAAYTDNETAFYTTMRAHRSGGLSKDHIYLQGFRKIRDHVQQTENLHALDDLYMGKIPLEELDELRTLRNACHIEASRHRPTEFLDRFRAITGADTREQGKNT